MEEFNTLAVTYRQPSAAFVTVDQLPFCGRPVGRNQDKGKCSASAESGPRILDGFDQECNDGVYSAKSNNCGTLETARKSDACLLSCKEVVVPTEIQGRSDRPHAVPKRQCSLVERWPSFVA